MVDPTKDYKITYFNETFRELCLNKLQFNKLPSHMQRIFEDDPVAQRQLEQLLTAEMKSNTRNVIEVRIVRKKQPEVNKIIKPVEP